MRTFKNGDVYAVSLRMNTHYMQVLSPEIDGGPRHRLLYAGGGHEVSGWLTVTDLSPGCQLHLPSSQSIKVKQEIGDWLSDPFHLSHTCSLLPSCYAYYKIRIAPANEPDSHRLGLLAVVLLHNKSKWTAHTRARLLSPQQRGTNLFFITICPRELCRRFSPPAPPALLLLCRGWLVHQRDRERIKLQRIWQERCWTWTLTSLMCFEIVAWRWCKLAPTYSHWMRN